MTRKKMLSVNDPLEKNRAARTDEIAVHNISSVVKSCKKCYWSTSRDCLKNCIKDTMFSTKINYPM